MKSSNKKQEENNEELVLQIEISENTGELFKKLERIATTHKLPKGKK